MKIFKTLGILVITVIAIAMILMLVLPTKQQLERSIIINASPAEVYNYLSKLENFNKWSIWNQNDSTLKYTITGTDGMPGAVNSWSGDPELSGEGKMQITTLKLNEKIRHHINFIKPRQMEADSDFELEAINNQTKVSWQFELKTPRPWNIFNVFSSLSRRMGKDFEEGLKSLKATIEKNNGKALTKTYNVERLDFPSTSFVLHRETVAWDDIPSFYTTHFPRIYNEAARANAAPGTPVGLYYVWDESNKQADMAAALTVSPDTKLSSDSFQLVNIPRSKAVYVDYYGAYDKSADAYKTIDDYLKANSLKQKTPVIEQYLTGPQSEKDTTKWLTKIIFLVE